MLLDQLSYLEDAGLIRLVQAEPELEYLFRHALVQEAAYESILKEDRRRLHQRVGETLEALYPDQAGELAATLAYHFGLAEDAPRALCYLVLAADAALERYAVAEAIAHYTQALETARRIGPAAEVPWLSLYRNLGRALELDAQYERALATYDEMAAVAQSRGDRAMELVALTEHAKLHASPSLAHDAAEGLALAERALALAGELGDRPAEARIEWVMMIVHWLQGRPREALAHGERSLALARELGLREQLAYTLQDIHRPHANMAHMEKARAALEEARALWRELNNLPMLADNLASTADQLSTHGEYDQALEFAHEAWQLSRSIGNLWNQAFGLAMAGEIHKVRGEFGTALQDLREAHALSARAGLVILQLRICGDLADIYLECNAPEEARQSLRPLYEDYHQEAPLREMFWLEAQCVLSRIEIRAGRPDTATAILERALQERGGNIRRFPFIVATARAEVALARKDYAQALGVLAAYLEARGDRIAANARTRFFHLHGQALLGLGRLDEAVPLLRAAAEQARALELRPRLWLLLVTLGRCESLRRNAEAAAAAFGEARQLVEALAAGLDDLSLRESFLNRPDVRALLEI